jgi:pimeloyl-ACP methyl ester carboxylesterase
VDAWYVGGHSLGGVGACRYAHANPDRVAGVVLFASYCDRDVSDAGRALAVTGSADVILDREAFRANRDRLPADATVVSVEGMNHTQFGSYRSQRGDAPAPLRYETAHERLREILVGFLRGT